MTTASAVLTAHLERVFNERDAGRREKAIRELYAAGATFYEQDAEYSGTEAITRAVTELLGALPPTLVFSMVAPAIQNHDMAKLLWRGHLPDGTTVVTGTDIAQITEGRIRSLHVFVDPAASRS
jgi:SnoaL-like domain